MRESDQPIEKKERFVFSLRHVERHFKGADGLSAGGIAIDRLDIPAGCMVAVLGESGSGKTTLLSLLGQLLQARARSEQRPDDEQRPRLEFRYWREGQEFREDLFLHDWQDEVRRVLGRSAIRREVGFVFQEAHLLRNATLSANLAVSLAPLAALPAPASELVRRMAESLESDRSGGTGESTGNGENGADATATPLGERKRSGRLVEKLSARVRVLSGGQAQRVALGRALVRNPSLVLADEPTASLDPRLASIIMAMLRNWQRAGSEAEPRTVIWVTHNVEQAAMFADKVIVLRRGGLPGWMAAQGCPANNPHDPAVLARWLETGEREGEPAAEVVRRMREAGEAWCERVGRHALDFLASDGESGNDGQDVLLSDAGNAEQAAAAAAPGKAGEDENKGEEKEKKGAETRLEEEKTDQAKSPEQLPKSPPRRFRPPGLLFRLAISEVFSHDEQGSRPRLLTRMMSLVDTPQANSPHLPWWRRLSWGRVLVTLLAMAVFGLLIAPGSAVSLSAVDHRLLAGLGGILLAWAVFWPYVRAFGKKMDLATYGVLMLTFFAAWKAWDIVDRAFAVRMASPGLSHVVVEVPDRSRFTDEAMRQLDARLLQAGFTPPAPSPAPERVRRRYQRQFFYGRHVLDVSVLAGKSAGDGTITCGRELFSSIDTLAVSMDEPFIARLQHLQGAVPGRLQPVPYRPLAHMKDNSNVYAVYVTEGFASRLSHKLAAMKGVQKPEPVGIGTPFCLDVYGRTEMARIAGIVRSLPEGVRGRRYELLTTADIASGSCRKHGQRCHALAAVYIDHGHLEPFMKVMQNWANEGVRVRPWPRRRNMATLYFNLGDAFTRIRDALALASVFNRAAAGAVLMIVFLTIAMTGISAHNYILRNERSLCVMRAFGIGTPRILAMMLVQFAMLLALPLLLTLWLAHGVWPLMAREVAQVIGLSPTEAALTVRESAAAIGWFLLIILGGCMAATAYWWWQSRWIAERLKEIG